MSTANTRTFNVLLTTEFSESSVFKSSNVHDEIFVVHIALKSSKQIFEEDFELVSSFFFLMIVNKTNLIKKIYSTL